MQDLKKTPALPESTYYKIFLAFAIVLTCILILGIRYLLKPQDTASGTAEGRNNVFNSNPGPLAEELPKAQPPDGEQDSGLDILKNANKGAFVERTSPQDAKQAASSGPAVAP